MIFGILPLTDPVCSQTWFVNVKSSDCSVKLSLLSRSKCSKLLAIFAPSGTFYKLNTQQWRFVTFHSSKKDLGEQITGTGIYPVNEVDGWFCKEARSSLIISVPNEQTVPPALISWPSYRPTAKNKTFQFRS